MLYRRWIRVLNEDGPIEIHVSEVHSGARGIYNSIEEHELDGQLWTRLFGNSHIAVMDDVLPKIT